MEQFKCPSTDEWVGMGKEDITHGMENYSAMRKKGILLLVTTWMDLESIVLNKSKTNIV